MPKSLSDRLLHRSREQRKQREYQRLQAQYRNLADARRFDIDWRSINFNRIAVVNLLLTHRPDMRYLEIGCDNNELFDAVIAKEKVGIDPQRGGTHRMTSDAFFAQNQAHYDLVFIDGLHTYPQTRRDLVHALDCVDRAGWIALHDMWPLDWLEEHVPRLSLGWTGDVWKLAFELVQSPELEFKLLKIDHGVGVVRVLKDGARLADRQAELADKRFDYFFANIAKLPTIDWKAGRDWIEQHLVAMRSQS
jgi:hypothetical protein